MVKSSDCVGISLEKWEALAGRAGRGQDPGRLSLAGSNKDDPKGSARGMAIGVSLEQRCLEGSQVHFSIWSHGVLQNLMPV